jgi:hypothetical protein
LYCRFSLYRKAGFDPFSGHSVLDLFQIHHVDFMHGVIAPKCDQSIVKQDHLVYAPGVVTLPVALQEIHGVKAGLSKPLCHKGSQGSQRTTQPLELICSSENQ